VKHNKKVNVLAVLPGRNLSRQQHHRVEIRINTHFSMTGFTHPEAVRFDQWARNTYAIFGKAIYGTRRCPYLFSNALMGGFPKRILVTRAP
jgi:hypothetical protein